MGKKKKSHDASKKTRQPPQESPQQPPQQQLPEQQLLQPRFMNRDKLKFQAYHLIHQECVTDSHDSFVLYPHKRMKQFMAGDVDQLDELLDIFHSEDAKTYEIKTTREIEVMIDCCFQLTLILCCFIRWKATHIQSRIGLFMYWKRMHQNILIGQILT